MPMFLVTEVHSGPQWRRGRPLDEQSDWPAHAAFMNELEERGFVVLGGPLDEQRVALAIEAASEDEVRETLDRDPWLGTHLVVAAVEPWDIRLDSRRGEPAT